MPQLDRYLISSEIFWFICFFLISYFFVYYFLAIIFRASRLRKLLFLQELWFTNTLKFEISQLQQSLKSSLEWQLLGGTKITKRVSKIANQFSVGWDTINLLPKEFENLTISNPDIAFMDLSANIFIFSYEDDFNDNSSDLPR